MGFLMKKKAIWERNTLHPIKNKDKKLEHKALWLTIDKKNNI